MRGSVLVVLCTIMVLVTPVLHALPRFALMSGTRCASCHINPTGGQMRNEYGVGYSIDKVPLEALKDSDLTFDPKLSENISIGGDYRSQFLFDNGSKTTSFHAMTTTIYGSIILNKKFSFYFKQDIINNVYGYFSGPEVFAIAKVFPGGWYIKGGDFLPNYGWRLDDHTGYTRGGDLSFIPSLGYNPGLIFTPNYKDVGMELGGYIGGLFITAGLFNGTGNIKKIDLSDQKAYVARVEYMGTVSSVNYRVGASGYGFNGFTMGGFTAGIGIDDLTLLGEIDWTKNYNHLVPTLGPCGYTMAAYAELDYRAVQGLWLIGKFDMFDPLQGRGNSWVVSDGFPNTNSIKRVTLGFEVFPYSFVEVRPQYRINIETPSISNDQGLVQMHLWF
ncbi:MAG: hypothetical protein HYR76_07675 [Ignavibacteria bacterium]|nr:hypothetical protein [Ignavibacteria bacterium]